MNEILQYLKKNGEQLDTEIAVANHTFSVTSGTIFAFHKLPLRVYLAAIAIYANAVKGISALQLARDLGVQYKTAFVLAHKIRESLMEQRDDAPLSGEVHMDGLMAGYLPTS